MNNNSSANSENLFDSDVGYKNASNSEQDNFVNNDANLNLTLTMWVLRYRISQ